MTLSLYAMAVSLVRCPLDRAEVDAFLVHFPEGRKLPQFCHLPLEEVGSIVDFFLGRKTAQGDANRAVRELVVAPERAQHVGRLERGRGAGRARRYGDVLHRHDQRLALDEIEADVEVVRNAPLEVAVE